VPNLPPEQDSPVHPEEITVTMLHKLPASPTTAREGNGAALVAAPATAQPPGRAGTAAPVSAPGRDPQSRLEALFDPGTLELLQPEDDSGTMAGTGSLLPQAGDYGLLGPHSSAFPMSNCLRISLATAPTTSLMSFHVLTVACGRPCSTE